MRNFQDKTSIFDFLTYVSMTQVNISLIKYIYEKWEVDREILRTGVNWNVHGLKRWNQEEWNSFCLKKNYSQKNKNKEITIVSLLSNN